MNTFNDLTDQERFVSRVLAREDLYYFSRYMFLARRNFPWMRSDHHQVICDALMRVYRGECKRLVINVPPRYSKTELAVVNFMVWALGKNPDAEFIHTSYAATLAVQNAANARELVRHEEFQQVFPNVQIRSDSAAKGDWKTEQGGVVYAAGSGGTITGFGAGKARPGFGGCFPVGTRVWTEEGLLPIDRIVRERMAINVWSFDYAGKMVLRPVTAWHENPPNDIVRITFDDGATVECTPDHRFWTDNRGWIRADSLSVDDRLPCVQGGVEGTDDVGIDAQCDSGRLDAFAVFPSGSALPVGDGVVGLLAGELGSQVGLSASLSNDIDAAGDRLPRFASPNLEDDGGAHSVRVGKVVGGNSGRVVDRQGLFVRENGAGVHLGFAESAMPLAVNDIGGAGIVPEIAEPVVAGVAVSMAHVGALGLGANKGQHDQLVNIENLGLGIPGQVDAEVTLTVVAGLEDSFGLDVFRPGARNDTALASDAPQVTDRVEPFISGHRKPVLVERVRHGDVTFCLTVDEYHNFTVESGLVVKNCIIIDDPHKPDEATSDVIRKGVIDWFQNTLESRRNSPDTPIIVIMQRLHEEDLAGWLLAGGNGEEWEHVCLEALIDEGLPTERALWPAKHTVADLKRLKRSNSYIFSGQYQQRPTPKGGAIIRGEWFPRYRVVPPLQWRAAYVDTAQKAKEHNDYTVFTHAGMGVDGRVYLLDVVRDKLDAVRLEQTAKDLHAKWKLTAPYQGKAFRYYAIEDKASGTGLIQQLKTKHTIPVKELQRLRGQDKYSRVMDIQGHLESGFVVLPEDAPWVADFIAECEAFTATDTHAHDDQVDTLADCAADMLGGNDIDRFMALAQ
nr:phage terminase large subunit [Paracandidimonas lactea]